MMKKSVVVLGALVLFSILLFGCTSYTSNKDTIKDANIKVTPPTDNNKVDNVAAKAMTKDDAINLTIEYLIEKNPAFRAVGYDPVAVANADRNGNTWIVYFSPPGPQGKFVVNEKTRKVTEIKE